MLRFLRSGGAQSAFARYVYEMTSKKSATSAGDLPTETGADPVSRFEASLKELDEIVARMERGDLPLEESLRLFERGTALTKLCRDALASAELRVKNLLEPQDAPDAESAG